MSKIVIDFGTTNTVVAVWRESLNAPETIRLPGLSIPDIEGHPPLIPSLIYVSEGGEDAKILAGYEVRAAGTDNQGDERYFSSFKRSISATSRPLPRLIDGEEWQDTRAGEAFLKRITSAVMAAEGGTVDELVLTVPIHSFEHYLKWIKDETSLLSAGQGVKRLRIVDESTAAALGYDIRVPGELILVFDFGGGTLDISLVRMPDIGDAGDLVIEANSRTGASLHQNMTARVIAKAGSILGGDDIDHWLLDELLVENKIDREQVADNYVQLKEAIEAAKIRLSAHESAEVAVLDPDTYKTYRATFTRSQLEVILDEKGFYSTIQRTLNKVLRTARQVGIYPEDIGAVLMVGGTSLIPSVRRMLRTSFGADRVFEHKPFDAVAHGALGMAVGIRLDDFLYHSYGIRILSPQSNRHEWEEIIPAGTRYPLEEPVEFILAASHKDQVAMELVVGEVEDSTNSVSEVMFGNRAILVVDGGLEVRRVAALNDDDGSRTVAILDPPGRPGEDRVKVIFNVDTTRMLRVTVEDLKTSEMLLEDAPVVELR